VREFHCRADLPRPLSCSPQLPRSNQPFILRAKRARKRMDWKEDVVWTLRHFLGQV
jgi:hypothetical protein